MNPDKVSPRPLTPSLMVGSQGQILQPWGPGGTANDPFIPIVNGDRRDNRDPLKMTETERRNIRAGMEDGRAPWL